MKIKDEAKILEDMINEDSLMNFDNEEEDLLIDRPCSDLVIVDPAERKEKVEEPDAEQDRMDDYEYARDVYIKTIEQGQEVLTGILEMAKAAPNPKAFEIAGQLMKINSDNADKLMKLSKEFKELIGAPKTSTEQKADVINNTQNMVFNGSVEDLIDLLNTADIKIIEENNDKV